MPIRAKRAWAHFIRKNGEAPKAIWKMPNGFSSDEPSPERGAMGMWIADYDSWKDYWDPNKPAPVPVKNVMSFVGRQVFIERALKKIKGVFNGSHGNG
jgi:hypothetical protein